jgi:hypothetical protein
VTAPAADRPAAWRWDIVLLQLVFVYLVGLRLWFDIAVNPMGDEAYYWMWASIRAGRISTIRRSMAGCRGS